MVRLLFHMGGMCPLIWRGCQFAPVIPSDLIQRVHDPVLPVVQHPCGCRGLDGVHVNALFAGRCSCSSENFFRAIGYMRCEIGIGQVDGKSHGNRQYGDHRSKAFETACPGANQHDPAQADAQHDGPGEHESPRVSIRGKNRAAHDQQGGQKQQHKVTMILSILLCAAISRAGRLR